MRELTVARKDFGLSDRTLTVLQALLSFHPDKVLDTASKTLIVYPSNAAICERLNGMACSTMRRHLATLVNAGLILRRDSPNGKRYVKRHQGEPQAFGFDLTPLLTRQPEICAISETIRIAENRYTRLRRNVSLMRRDLAGLAVFGQETQSPNTLWTQLQNLACHIAKTLRRKVEITDLIKIETDLKTALNQARDVFENLTPIETSSNNAQIEQHHQNSDKDLYDLEPCLEVEPQETNKGVPSIPIGMVLTACKEVKIYAPDGIRHWHHLVQAAETVRPMMGISITAWHKAIAVMGLQEASVVVAAILERFTEIKSPGGYLRHLTKKAENGDFSCGPMIMALMRRHPA